MDSSIFRYILRHTYKQQILLVVLTAISMPFVYASLEVPKIIINEAIGGQNIPNSIWGIPIDQVKYLLFLSFLFIALIALNGGFKYFLNVYRGVLGERMLRRFRYELYTRVLRFPLAHFKRTSPAEIIPMITAETEPLGGFIGDAIALPAFQGSLLATYLMFIFQQDPWLGFAAVVLYPPQMYLIPKLQRKVNALSKQRVQTVRKLADRIGESASGVTEIHAHDASRFERADISHRLGKIFHIRYDIYRLKFLIKFLNNFLGQLTPFFFFSIGGYFVIMGQLSLGALVAVLAAYKDLASPWKELLKYYQTTEDVRVKYAQIIEQFQPPSMLDQRLLDAEIDRPTPFSGTLASTNLTYTEDQIINLVDGAGFNVDFPGTVAVVGKSGEGQQELAMLIARLIQPSAGRIALNDQSLADMPESMLGRRIGYVGQNAYIFNGTVRSNLVYGLQRRPAAGTDRDSDTQRSRANELKEARATANSLDDIGADWIDYEAAGVTVAAEIEGRIVEILKVIEADEDIYHLGLYSTVEPTEHPELAERILVARQELLSRLRTPEFESLVESFDADHYNRNMTVAENLLFGQATDPAYSLDNLATNDAVLAVLHDTDLYNDFLKIGHRLAGIMIELFADVSADSDLFQQFSFIGADDLPTFAAVMSRTNVDNLDSLGADDRAMLLSLPFKLIPARHRLGLVEEELQDRLLGARKKLMGELGNDGRWVNFFASDRYHPSISLQDNILFGRLAYGQAHGQARVGELIAATVANLGLRDDIIRAGLNFQVGIAGSRLSAQQRQKIALGRCLLKRPDVLVVNDATSAFDPATENRLVVRLIEHMVGRGVIWALGRPELAAEFQNVIVVDRGKVIGSGAYDEILGRGGLFSRLLGVE